MSEDVLPKVGDTWKRNQDGRNMILYEKWEGVGFYVTKTYITKEYALGIPTAHFNKDYTFVSRSTPEFISFLNRKYMNYIRKNKESWYGQ